MSILERMQNVTTRFEVLSGSMQEQDEVIAKANATKEQIQTEMLRLQGEYRLLVDMGKETGELDSDGNPVQAAEEVKIEE